VSVRSIGVGILVLGATAAVACSSPDAPRPLPTVLVTNETCDSARCRTLEVRAFVWKFTVPQWPQGFKVLGEAPPGQTCFTFPPSWSLRISGPDSTGRVDTLIITWTPDDTIPIYLVAVDSAFFHGHATAAQIDSSRQGLWPYDGFFPGSVGETRNFAPRDAPGWSVTFPSAPLWSANLADGERCNA